MDALAARLVPLIVLAALTACGARDDPSKQADQTPTVSVAPVVKRQVQEFDEFTGRLEAPHTVDVRSRVAGTLVRVHFKEGQLAKKGDPLFTVDPRPYAAEVARAEAQLQSARTQSELSKSELARAEKLVAVRGVSAQELDQLKAAAANSGSSIRAGEAALTQARLNLEFTKITAPVDGRTSRANVTEGNLVNVGDPVLTTVVSTDRVYAYFDASEALYLKYMRAAREGTRPSSRDTPSVIYLGLANEQGFPHQGKMDFVDNRLSPATASLRGRAVFDNKDGLFTPGLFVRLKLVGSGNYSATVVADRAVTTDQTRKVVLVIGKNNIVEQREVKPGALIDGMRVVEGVKEGELVIVDGLLRAFPGAPVTPQVLKVDDKGMPIPAPPPTPPAPAKG
ncbi:efflux RND transporter periplasmic adaptor subunit [Massilia sp. RP-1-19]|uniref:Efflux RND transporter periplasmic adaptor subunit n=1 Tax=Massilia polaris TaxID=2728846 RepID=A0A848HVX4_9BURK|nr:efflux RND transporter periplasmic adaptor subunit [Massilia polaris]NML63453.1 efflux RND transporter periplasmic adaptor subunit [Massilia polaris]